MTVIVPAEVARGIRLAAHAVTWMTTDDAGFRIPTGDRIEPWLDDVVAAGYQGVAGFGFQLQEFFDRPTDFRRLLEDRGLELAALTGLVDDSPETARRQLEFCAALGTGHLACTDFDTTLTIPRAIEILDERARVGAALGVKVYYHNHTGGVGETLTEVEQLLAGLDPRDRHVMVDVGHATKDFAELSPERRALEFLTRHWGSVEFMEFKDWSEETDLATPLGEGRTDYEAILRLLAGGGYTGWIVVEQNGATPGRSSVECATASREFLRAHGL